VTRSHHERAHAQWAASATQRNWTCAGALAMATLAGEEVESEYAARGTAAHEVAHGCLEPPTDAEPTPYDFIGRVIKTKQHEIEVDQEIADTAYAHIEYILKDPADQIWIEKQFSLAALDPPFEAGGTIDAAKLFRAERMIEIVDLKGGTGVVEVNENKQTRSYALALLLNMPEVAREIDWIKVTIVQPRAPHPDGRIRSETFHVADLIDWTGELLLAMGRSKAALDAFEALDGSKPAFEAWTEVNLTTGACKFCPAEGFCPKLRGEALAASEASAKEWFEVANDGVYAPVMGRELGEVLDKLEMVEDWIKAVRAYAHRRAEAGEAIPGWMLVDKIGNRAWLDADETITARYLSEVLLLGDAQIYEPKEVRSPAQIEKVMGAKRKQEFAAQEGKLWHRPVKGTNLVSAAKTTRAPALSGPAKFFEATETGEK
jgi:hypothetical protein